MARFVTTIFSLLLFLTACTNLNASEQIFRCENIYIKMDREGAGREGLFSAQFIESNSAKWEPFCEFFGIATSPKTSKNTILCEHEQRTTYKFDETEIVAKARKYRCDQHYESCDKLYEKSIEGKEIKSFSLKDLGIGPDYVPDITFSGLRRIQKTKYRS